MKSEAEGQGGGPSRLILHPSSYVLSIVLFEPAGMFDELGGRRPAPDGSAEAWALEGGQQAGQQMYVGMYGGAEQGEQGVDGLSIGGGEVERTGEIAHRDARRPTGN